MKRLVLELDDGTELSLDEVALRALLAGEGIPLEGEAWGRPASLVLRLERRGTGARLLVADAGGGALLAVDMAPEEFLQLLLSAQALLLGA